MVINENNSQINAFVKGMNSDTTYDQVDHQQYVFGKNIRITKNDFVGGVEENTASLREGAVTPVPYGLIINNPTAFATNGETLLAVDSINNIAVVITYGTGYLNIYKYTFDEDSIYGSGVFCKIKIDQEYADDFAELKQVSTVMYKELEGVIKLYIATGIYPILELRVDENGQHSSQNIDDYINNRILPTKPVYIQNKIDGALKTSLILYTYRFYNKFGITTQLAPLTNKIQVIDDNRNKEVGNAQDTTTSIGFLLTIPSIANTLFDRLLIFRLLYIAPGQDADVILIYDGERTTTYNDVGTVELQNLTMQEFAAMSGMVIIPKVIEQNQQYLFASNIKDDTIIEDPLIGDDHGSILCVFKQVTLSTSLDDIPTQSQNGFNQDIKNYIKSRNVNPDLAKDTYNNIFTSSLLRSLRRGEKYRYGIVYYDSYGRHTNVIPIQNGNDKSIEVPEISANNPLVSINNGHLVANVCGVEITIPQPQMLNIIGCQIVRRSSKPIYLKALLQVALARPIRLNLYETSLTEDQFGILRNSTRTHQNTVPREPDSKSPYYPTGFLSTGYMRITNGYYSQDGYYTIGADEDVYGLGWAQSDSDAKLFLIFSQEIDFRRDDVLSKLKSSTLEIVPKFNATLSVNDVEHYNQQSKKHLSSSGTLFSSGHSYMGGLPYIFIDKRGIIQDGDSKSSEYMIFPLYYTSNTSTSSKKVRNVKDTKQPQWYDGFSNLQLAPNQDNVSSIGAGAIKKYKQFTTNIENTVYNNWISFGLYDLRISSTDDLPNVDGTVFKYIALYNTLTEKSKTENMIAPNFFYTFGRHGYIGPGPSCFVISTESEIQNSGFGTLVCNLEHNITEGDNEPDEFVQYFGFGNFFELEYDRDQHKYLHKGSDKVVVFDGDVYVTPHEITTMYKTYDFMSYDTLQSMLITNYVPMESKVNTFFNYGMNFLNTNSTNLLLEPGSIDGITTQDRPANQYNQIYSANDESNDVFSLVVEKAQDNEFKQRTYYSEPKTNGEYVDNFVIFKPAAYIDVDPKYGQVTELLTDKNVLYYWQESAFGKFSVNERSLINDLNGNTIMLGQAGILSRNDYLSTRYGMREEDFCAVSTETGVYWVDINNKAVVGYNTGDRVSTQNRLQNLGEVLNVQNIINRRISEDIPRVDYDLQNNELLCKCLLDNEQIIFNLKLGVATSIYTRNYKDIANILNHLYGINQNNKFIKYNYLEGQNDYLNPVVLSFVVNPSASTTKVFDCLSLVPAKRRMWDNNSVEANYTNLVYSFETDIMKTDNSVERMTDREGNITYNIPRFGEGLYGNRLRGKWMRVNITANNPDEYTTISHVITKFRQSYS